MAGQSIVGRIHDGVGESSCCVFILNQHSLNSNWCMAEVGAFWGAGKPVIIFPTEPTCDPPGFLHELKKADTPEEVVKACRKIIQDLPPPPSPPPAFVKTLQEGGLVNAVRIPVDDHDREDRVEQLVREERQRSNKKFRLVASSGFNYLNGLTGQVWRRGLGHAIVSERAEFSVVLESPFSTFSETRALANDKVWDHWEYKVNTTELLELVKRHRVECSCLNFLSFLLNEPVVRVPLSRWMDAVM